jgi:hypothetical protein
MLDTNDTLIGSTSPSMDEGPLAAMLQEVRREYQCPYKRVCWTRELIRWLLPALIAYTAAHLIGCGSSGSFQLGDAAFGVQVKATWKTPPPNAAQTTPPIATTKPTSAP